MIGSWGAAAMASGPAPEEVSRALEHRFFRTMGALYETAEALFALPLESRRTQRALHGALDELPDTSRLYVFADDGRLRNQVARGLVRERTPPAGLVLAHRRKLEAGECFVTITVHEQEGPPTCDVVVPLYHGDGTWRGSLCAVLPLEAVLEEVLPADALSLANRLHLLLGDGYNAVTLPPEAAPVLDDAHLPSQETLRKRLLREPAGVGSYHAVDEEAVHLVTRELRWAEGGHRALRFIVVSEIEKAFLPDASNPMSGKWMGAYTAEGGMMGGPLNVLLLQDGDACSVRAIGSNLRVAAEGAVEEGRISAARSGYPQGRGTTWHFYGVYDPEKDAIRGTMAGHAPGAVFKKTYFLKRAEPREERLVEEKPGPSSLKTRSRAVM